MVKSLMFLCLLIDLFLAPLVYADCPRLVYKSKASYFQNDQALQSGACGYGGLALGFYGGHLAAASPSIYKDGLHCGACFQVRCKHQGICSNKGTVVFVSDLNRDSGTDFVLSRKAFMAMANKGKDQDVLKLGIADVEYARVPCLYKKNLSIRVEEMSQKPNFLAVKFLYQGGQTEIAGIEVAQVTKDPRWTSMGHNYGAVWSMSNVPTGELQMRFTVNSGYEGAMHLARRSLPANWTKLGIYDLGFQFNDISCT